MFNFNKRISGKTYYLRYFLSIIGLVVFAIVIDAISKESVVGTIVVTMVALVWLVFVASQIRQRANDIGEHPILLTALALWTPFSLVIGLLPGQRQTNKFGPVPK